MSHTWREYAKTQDAPDRASKHLYMILADKARDAEFVDKRRYRHPANACWPSLPALAVEAQMSERSLNRSIGKLVEAGLIKRVRHQRRNADFIMLIRSENPSEEASFRNAVDGVSRTQFRNAKTGRFETPPTASNIKEKEKNNFRPSSASSAREEDSGFSMGEKPSPRANGAKAEEENQPRPNGEDGEYAEDIERWHRLRGNLSSSEQATILTFLKSDRAFVKRIRAAALQTNSDSEGAMIIKRMLGERLHWQM